MLKWLVSPHHMPPDFCILVNPQGWALNTHILICCHFTPLSQIQHNQLPDSIIYSFFLPPIYFSLIFFKLFSHLLDTFFSSLILLSTYSRSALIHYSCYILLLSLYCFYQTVIFVLNRTTTFVQRYQLVIGRAVSISS